MSDDVKPPTCQELLDEEGFEEVHSESERWRHGTTETTVFKRESDLTYWQVSYQLQSDGEYNGLRDGDASISRVYPHTVTTVVYKDE